MAKVSKSLNRPGPGGGRSGGGAGNYFMKKSAPKNVTKKSNGPKNAEDLKKLKQALGKKVEKKVTKPDSPFLKFVEPKRKNTANIQQTLKKLKEEKNNPKVVNLADFKKKKFKRGK